MKVICRCCIIVDTEIEVDEKYQSFPEKEELSYSEIGELSADCAEKLLSMYPIHQAEIQINAVYRASDEATLFEI